MDSEDVAILLSVIIISLAILTMLYFLVQVTIIWLAWVQDVWLNFSTDLQWIMNLVGGPVIIVLLLSILAILLRLLKLVLHR